MNLREPRFEPEFQILPHTLLAGSTPGFTIELRQIANDMRLEKTEIEFEKTELLLDGLAQNDSLGLSTEFTSSADTFQLLQVTDIDGSNSVNFDVIRGIQNRTEVSTRGELRKGSTVLTLDKVPEPPPESVTRTTFRTRMVLKDGLFRLPQSPGESFDITARFTSTTVFRGQEFKLTKTITRTFQTSEPEESAPRIQIMRPIHGEIGRRLEIKGSGFGPDLENTLVTFAGVGNTRVDGILKSTASDEIVVFVPNDAVTGPVRVKVDGLESNDFQFRVMFRPQAALFFPDEDDPGPLAPNILLSQGNDDFELDTLTARVDGVNLNLGSMQIDDIVGAAPLIRETFGQVTALQIFYTGLEQEESGRHMFELKEDAESSAQATLFASQEVDASRVTFALVRNGLRMRVQSLVIDFETGILVPQDEATPIEMMLEVRSVQWNFFAGTEMVVLSRFGEP